MAVGQTRRGAARRHHRDRVFLPGLGGLRSTRVPCTRALRTWGRVLNGHQRHAFDFVIFNNLLQPFFVVLCGRAMVTGEDDNQDGRLLEIFEGIFLAIHARQLEVRGRRSQFESRKVLGLRGEDRRREKQDKDQGLRE